MTEQTITFNDLGLPDYLLSAVETLGFTTPSPIQQECIPYLLNGDDVLGVAQTGSGKTAAFSLPLLTKIDVDQKHPQLLVMAPTRELAIQVAEACESFAQNMKKLKIVTLYGGQRYDIQLRALKQGSHVVVGTPGRLLDHIRRGTLDLSQLKGIVLDEADEMLRMGFIDDVETIMAEIPSEHQTALFSATMPAPIKKITKRFMREPKEIKIKTSTKNTPDIEQVCCAVRSRTKNESLVRFLEVENYDAAIIFVRTKSATLDLADLLNQHGFNAAALNGDMTQQLREQTLDKLKKGSLNILIATDVAARGLDVDRISLVINYDIPLDAESYVHRIGRTGRAGRAGKAILFVDAREKRLLRNIEHLIKKPITEVPAPTHIELETSRREKFKAQITKQLEHKLLEKYRSLIEDLFSADQDIQDIAAAMMMLLQGKQTLILPPDPVVDHRSETRERNDRRSDRDGDRRRSSDRRDRGDRNDRGDRAGNNMNFDLYRIEIGRADGIEARHIVGAIANEGDISSRFIGHIKLYDDHSTIELPQNMPKDLLKHFTKTKILNKAMKMSMLGGGAPADKAPRAPRYVSKKQDGDKAPAKARRKSPSGEKFIPEVRRKK